MINVFLRVFLDDFRQTSRFNYCPSKESSFYLFGVFVDCRGGGDPYKRIFEGLF